MTVIKAAIFMPEEELQNAVLVSRCFGTIARGGYIFDSIVSSWEQLMSMLAQQEVQVVVYARPEHIDPSWTPRFELAEEEADPIVSPEAAEGVPPSRSTSRRSRRPKPVR